MDLIADALLLAGALSAAFYCWALSRRVKSLNDLDKGVGSAIANLSSQVGEMQTALKATQSVTGASIAEMEELAERAERAAENLRLMLATVQEDKAEVETLPRKTRRQRRSGKKRTLQRGNFKRMSWRKCWTAMKTDLANNWLRRCNRYWQPANEAKEAKCHFPDNYVFFELRRTSDLRKRRGDRAGSLRYLCPARWIRIHGASKLPCSLRTSSDDRGNSRARVVLEDAENRLADTLALADNAAEKDLERLTSVYENMKPKEAADIFETMDVTFAAGFLSRMRPDAAAGILSNVDKTLAYAISVAMAGRNIGVPTE